MIRLLIVDDHEMVREGLKAMLDAEPDFSIVGEAANAEQALDLVAHLRPDIALLDIKLPGMSGIELCRRGWQHPGRQFPGLSDPHRDGDARLGDR